MKKILILIALILIIVIIFWLLKGQKSAESMSGSQHVRQSESQSTTPETKLVEDSAVKKVFDNNIKVEMPVTLTPVSPQSILTSENISIQDAYVRGFIPGSKNTAAYLNIETKKKFAIAGLSSPQFDRVELHETIKGDGDLMSMEKLEYLTIEAPGVSLTPGGKHIMLIGSKGDLGVGDTVEINVSFSGRRGGKMKINLPIVDQ